MTISQEELDTFKIFDGVKVVFDVGSRDDLQYQYIRPDCTYHLFEPNPEFARMIEARPNVIVNNYGLSDKAETKIYYPSSQSFINRGNDLPGESYDLITMDDYAECIDVDFIKIDTEGYDYKVLLGAEKTLKKAKYVQFEYWTEGVRKFYDLLSPDFDMSLIIEPVLREAIRQVTKDEKYNNSTVSLTSEVMDLIEDYLIPAHCMGNILCKKRQ